MDDFRDYAARGRNSFWRYFAALALALLLTIAIGVALGLAATAAGLVSASQMASLAHPSEPVLFFAANGVLFAVLLVSLLLAVRWINGKRPRDLFGRWSWPAAGAGAGLWSVVLVLAAGVDFVLAPNGFTASGGAATLGLAAAALPALAVQTLAEEAIFRGYLTQGLLLAFKRPGAAAVASGLLFGAAHIPNGLPQAVEAAAFGVALALIAIRTGGLGFGWGLHLANNLFGALVVASRQDVFQGAPALFTEDTPQLMWIDVAVSLVGLAAVTTWRLRAEAPDTHASAAETFD